MKRDFLADILKTFVFSLSQGMAESTKYPGARGTRAGQAASLQAPMLMAQIEEKRKQDEEDRQLRLQQIQATIANQQNDNATQAFNAAKGSMAPEVPLTVPRGMSVDPRAQGQVYQGDTQMGDLPLQKMPVGGAMVQPPSLQDAERLQWQTASRVAQERAGIDLERMREEKSIDLKNRIKEIQETAANRPLPVPPQAPVAIQEYLLWVSQQKPGADKTYERFLKIKEPPRQMMDLPITIQTVDPDGNPVTRVLPRSAAMAQGEFAASPTAEQRNRAVSYERAGPVIDSIAELSEKINTQAGLIAKMSGGAERIKAQANYNDDVSEYQAIVDAFTPLVARSLGHVGVLTDEDVRSVKSIFPKVGDSKTLRDRKIARIRKLVSQIGAVKGDTAPLDDAIMKAMEGLK